MGPEGFPIYHIPTSRPKYRLYSYMDLLAGKLGVPASDLVASELSCTWRPVGMCSRREHRVG